MSLPELSTLEFRSDENDFDVGVDNVHNGREMSYMDLIDLHTAATLDQECFETVLGCNYGNINKRNLSGWTPLMYACRSGNIQAVEILLSMKVDESLVNNVGESALHIAASNGYDNAIDLFDYVSRLDVRDARGWTPLVHALEMGHTDTAKYLVQKGADVNIINEESGHSVLMMAVYAEDRFSCERIVPLMVASGANHKMISRDKKTASDIAFECGYQEIALFLRDPHAFHLPRKPPQDLKAMLTSINQTKYLTFFEDRQVDLYRFLSFTEQDLKCIGIKLLGPRKTMALAIEKHNYEQAMGLHRSN